MERGKKKVTGKRRSVQSNPKNVDQPSAKQSDGKALDAFTSYRRALDRVHAVDFFKEPEDSPYRRALDRVHAVDFFKEPDDSPYRRALDRVHAVDFFKEPDDSPYRRALDRVHAVDFFKDPEPSCHKALDKVRAAGYFKEADDSPYRRALDRVHAVDFFKDPDPLETRALVNPTESRDISSKVNQIGTVTEAIEVTEMAKDAQRGVGISERSGETNESFISDLSVGVATCHIKSGTQGDFGQAD